MTDPKFQVEPSRQRFVMDDESTISALLDEVYALRKACAYEAQVIAAHLTFKTFPKTRRVFAENQIERLTEAAKGRVQRSYAGIPYLSRSLRSVGASETLTRFEWERGAM